MKTEHASIEVVAPSRLTTTSPVLGDLPEDPITVLLFGSVANAQLFAAKFEVVN